MTIPQVDGRGFPKLPLPFPIPYPPMEARRVETLPEGDDWQFEPKWDGFRCLAFRWKDEVALQSKAGQPLTRYFPELVAAFRQLPFQAFVLDGEIVVPVDGIPSFDDLLLRIHPAASRIAKLAQQTPAKFFAFDLLYDPAENGRLSVNMPLTNRRESLERFFETVPRKSPIELSPATRDRILASSWFANMGPLGLDGVVAKKIHENYHSGDREGMVKVKHMKTADCVVGGFRYSASKVGSLLLGLYDESGQLDFVGHTSSFSQAQRTALRKTLEPLRGGMSFTGRTPGGPSRWSAKRNMEWEPVKPVLVCEVRYDYFAQNRFRHGTAFLRWRPEKDPKSCTMDQVAPARARDSP